MVAHKKIQKKQQKKQNKTEEAVKKNIMAYNLMKMYQHTLQLHKNKKVVKKHNKDSNHQIVMIVWIVL